jgi:hypothetical protein
VVLDVANLTPGRENYYLEKLADDREEYLSGHGESPGRWYGRGAARLGLEGEATKEGFRRLIQGRHVKDQRGSRFLIKEVRGSEPVAPV